MNKLLKVTLQSLFILISLNLSAQNQYVVTPTNSGQVTTEIIEDFQHLISISSGQLQGHLGTLVDPAIYCAPCPLADMNIQENAPNTLQLSWAPVPNADYYEIAYLNLATGTSNSFIESGNSHTLTSFPNGAYAFSIVTYSTNGAGEQMASGGPIIIEETPALIDFGGDPTCPCVHQTPVLLDHTEEILTWDPGVFKRFEFDINYGESLNMKMTLYSIPAPEFDEPVKFLLECSDNLSLSWGGNTLFPVDAFHPEMHLTYDDEDSYSLNFHSVAEPISVDLYKCTAALPRKVKDDSMASILIFPNPAMDKLWISHQLKTEESSLISIFDPLGNKIIEQELLTENEAIDISTFSAGIYTIQIKSNKKTSSQTFMKL